MTEAADHEDTTRDISGVSPDGDRPGADDSPQPVSGTPPADPQAQADGSDSGGDETVRDRAPETAEGVVDARQADPADPGAARDAIEDVAGQGKNDTGLLLDSPTPETVVAEVAESDREAGSPQAEESERPVQAELVDEPEKAETVAEPPSKIERDVAELGVLLTDSRQRLDRLEEAVLAIDDKVSLIPRQVRSLGAKVEGLTTSVSEPRYRAVMMDLLRIYDMVDQMCSNQSGSQGHPEPSPAHQCDVLRTQILQVLIINGLTEIPADGEFDPELHRAVSRAPCDDETLAGRIKSVTRVGFRTEQSILRYAEVDVWHYEAAQEPPAQETQQQELPAQEAQQQEPSVTETEQPQVEPEIIEVGAAEEIGDATDESQVT